MIEQQYILTNKEDISNYKKKIVDALKLNGCLLIIVFAENGPDKCSGLPIKKYSINALRKEFQKYDLLHGSNHSHFTPTGIEQKFVTCLFQLR
tara:strand:- start:118 stop:396 length:279 start_codon:yes stop_codon:yes gene_type:complete